MHAGTFVLFSFNRKKSPSQKGCLDFETLRVICVTQRIILAKTTLKFSKSGTGNNVTHNISFLLSFPGVFNYDPLSQE